MKYQVISVLACLFIVGHVSAAPATQSGTGKSTGLHKWVDEQGQVHYGDSIPPQYLNQKREVLNEQGVIVKTYEAPKTKEQLAKEKQEKDALEKTKREKVVEEKKKELRDRMLLETYTTEHDILLQRDDRIQAVDSQIQITQGNIKESEKKQAEVKDRIEKTEKSGREVPENFRKEADTVAKQLHSYHQFIEAKNLERTEIIKKFDEDLQRFRELKAQQAN
jgi:hypothetical protein